MLASLLFCVLRQPPRLFRAAGLIRMPRAPKLKFEAFLLLVSWEFEAPCTRIDLSFLSAAGGQVYLSKEEVGGRGKKRKFGTRSCSKSGEGVGPTDR